ncbi:MAG: YeeE/YedE family protein [Deltaproteobacteria bacterium]|nr:YeeE/YedE family protein [Deltaproteobacteria bacterium]
MDFDSQPVSWVRAVLGGGLIGLAASVFLGTVGRVAGVSGILGGLLKPSVGDIGWRVWFILGLLFGGIAAWLVSPSAFFEVSLHRPLPLLVIAGVLVGFGTRLGQGCTSGHGVCGLSRFSVRSIVATLTFMGFGVLTVALWRGVFGGGS